MAEPAAVSLGIAGVQGTWFFVKKIRASHPKRRLRKWEDKIADALERVDKQYSNIKPSDMRKLMHKHAQYDFSIVRDIGCIPRYCLLGGRS